MGWKVSWRVGGRVGRRVGMRVGGRGCWGVGWMVGVGQGYHLVKGMFEIDHLYPLTVVVRRLEGGWIVCRGYAR